MESRWIHQWKQPKWKLLLAPLKHYCQAYCSTFPLLISACCFTVRWLNKASGGEWWPDQSLPWNDNALQNMIDIKDGEKASVQDFTAALSDLEIPCLSAATSVTKATCLLSWSHRETRWWILKITSSLTENPELCVSKPKTQPSAARSDCDSGGRGRVGCSKP